MRIRRGSAGVVVVTLAGCLSILEPPDSTGIEADGFGRCNTNACSGNYGCSYGECVTTCFSDSECKSGFICDDYGDCVEPCRPRGCPGHLACVDDVCLDTCFGDDDCTGGAICCTSLMKQYAECDDVYQCFIDN